MSVSSNHCGYSAIEMPRKSAFFRCCFGVEVDYDWLALSEAASEKIVYYSER
jgi:hypothetical protein